MPAVTVIQPIVAHSLTDGTFSGLAAGPPTPPGTINGYPSSRNYFGIPPVTAVTAAVQRVAPVNKLIVYVNGIGTNRDTHAYTVKLISVITGANVIGIYNQSGDGMESGKGDMLIDGIQCLGDKTGLGNNVATNTLARSVFKACTSAMPLNIVAHSQGAIITSRAMRQGIGMLLDFYGRRDPTVRPLLERADVILNASIWQRVLAGTFRQVQELTFLMSLNAALQEKILPIVEQKLNEFVSAQTFGGAARFYPNGPRYRHVFNVWDPVPLFGQNDIFTGPGRGARVESIDRDSEGFITDHSITDLYLQSSDHYIDQNGNRVDNNYIPIDMNMLR